MEPLPVDLLAQAVGGRLMSGNPRTVVRGVSTDSRTLAPGDLFVPLKGERFDGHDFVPDALARGAAATFWQEGRPFPVRGGASAAAGGRGAVPGGAAVIAVDDPLAALHRLAKWQRSRLGARVVAVTGSNGKTTTKDMAAAVLSVRWSMAKSAGNYNNEVGLPLAVLAAPRGTQVLVLEMAMRGPGQIRQLAEIARPDVGIVTNVGPVHLELLGSIENIAKAKQELVEALPEDGWAVLNADDPLVRAMAGAARSRTIFYGCGPEADVQASAVVSRGLEGIEFTLHWQGQRRRISVPAPGRHNVYNALAAAGAALALGLTLDEVAWGLAAYSKHASAMRMELRVRSDGVRVINDAYNASPASMAAALELLRELDGGRRVAILGDMLELGPLSEAAHREVGRVAAATRVDQLAAVGRWSGTMAAAAVEAGLAPGRVATFPDAAAAAAWAKGFVRPGDVVLVKASRGLRLERVAAALLEGQGGESA